MFAGVCIFRWMFTDYRYLTGLQINDCLIVGYFHYCMYGHHNELGIVLAERILLPLPFALPRMRHPAKKNVG